MQRRLIELDNELNAGTPRDETWKIKNRSEYEKITAEISDTEASIKTLFDTQNGLMEKIEEYEIRISKMTAYLEDINIQKKEMQVACDQDKRHPVVRVNKKIVAGIKIVGPQTSMRLSCDLRDDTNGEQIPGEVCTLTFDGVDNEVADYLLRNCVKNEEALLRQASSAVLSLDDYLARGKEKQKETAAGYLCSYADKADLLVGAGKLVLTVDLAEDARDIAEELLFPCD